MQWWNSAWDSGIPWPMFLPMLWPIVIIGGTVLLVMLLVRGAKTGTPPSGRRDSSRQTSFEILRERFARGEIDRHEYEERKGLLSQP
jgi:putative membrane protein